MNQFLQTADVPAEPELFPYTWLTSPAVRDIILTAPIGISLLTAIDWVDSHNLEWVVKNGYTADFEYVMVNLMQQAMLKMPADDVVGQPITLISPDVIPTGILNRLQQVCQTGRPQASIERYQIDGAVGKFNQIYLQSGNGVLLLVHDVSYRPLTAGEQQQQAALLHAITNQAPAADVRAILIRLISGQLY